MSPVIRARRIDRILDDVFRQYRDHLGPLFVISLIFVGPYTLISAILTAATPAGGLFALSRANSLAQYRHLLQTHAGIPAEIAVLVGSWLLLALLSIQFLLPLTSASYYLLAERSLIARRAPGEPWTYVRGAIRRYGAYISTEWLLIGLGAAAIAAIGIVFGGIALAIGALAHAGPAAGLLALFALLLYIAAACAAIWIGVKLSFAFCAVVLEGTKNWRAVGRSWQLTGKAFWRILLTLAIAQIVIGLATLGLDALTSEFIQSLVLQYVVDGLVTVLLYPFIPLVTVHLYIDSRARKEGYNVDPTER